MAVKVQPLDGHLPALSLTLSEEPRPDDPRPLQPSTSALSSTSRTEDGGGITGARKKGCRGSISEPYNYCHKYATEVGDMIRPRDDQAEANSNRNQISALRASLRRRA